MQSRWFWSNWNKDYKYIWFGLIGIFIFSFIFCWFSYFQGADGIIHWEKIQEQKVLESTVHTFKVGPFQLSVPAENYVIIEYFNGSSVNINSFASLAFIAILVFSAIVLLTIITILPRFWYFFGMALFILFIVSLRLEVIVLLGQRNQITGLSVLTLFILLSYYFHALRPSHQFKTRLFVFLGLTIFIGLMIYFFARVDYPILHLSVTGFTAGILLSVVFIFMVAHEIPVAFIYITSQGNSKNLRHFTILSVIYIMNVIIACLHEMDIIQWNFVYINLYLLLSISALLGLWGFKLRENLYDNIFSFAPYGAYCYVALATICFITIGHFLGSSNDSALRIIRDAIAFSHVGYGVIFLTYIFSNFILMMAQNIQVYKILYKPNRMPHFTFRLAGFIMILGFVFYSNWHEYVYNSIAGFYNSIGDLYGQLHNPTTRQAYYEQAKSYGFQNNHANYELGTLNASAYEFDAAHKNYELANGKTPTIYSLINDGNVFLWERDFKGSIQAYRFGLKFNLGSGEMQNNLGSAYARIHNIDSAVYFLNKARQSSNSKASAETNIMALAALEYLPINGDSILTQFANPSDATLANAIALTTSAGKEFKTKVDVLTNKHLNLYSATLLNNYIIQHVKNSDSVFLKEAYQIASDSLNSDFSESLKASLAFAFYHQENVAMSLRLMAELAYISQSHQGKFNYTMGLWALEQNNPVLAASYFNYAVDADYKEAKLYRAIALSEAQQVDDAVIAWDTVRNSKDDAQIEMANRMIGILKMDFKNAMTLNDPEKYQFCRYRFNIKDTSAFSSIIKTFISSDYKAQALLDMATRQFEWGNLSTAIRYFNQIGGLKLTDKKLYEQVQHLELFMLAERKDVRALAQQINKEVVFGDGRKLEKIYFTALLNEYSGDTINAAKNFEMVSSYNPYFEEGVIATANYFRTHAKNKMKAYAILAEAIQVNTTSVKLMKAYADEALRLEFTEYYSIARERIKELYDQLK